MNSPERYKLVRTATADPAAGANASIATPGPFTNNLILLSFLFTPDANVATRLLDLFHNNGTTSRLIGICPLVAVASTAARYAFSINPCTPISTANPRASSGIPGDLDLSPTDTLDLTITAIQVGDQLSEITHWWKIFY